MVVVLSGSNHSSPDLRPSSDSSADKWDSCVPGSWMARSDDGDGDGSDCCKPAAMASTLRSTMPAVP